MANLFVICLVFMRLVCPSTNLLTHFASLLCDLDIQNIRILHTFPNTLISLWAFIDWTKGWVPLVFYLISRAYLSINSRVIWCPSYSYRTPWNHSSYHKGKQYCLFSIGTGHFNNHLSFHLRVLTIYL